MGTDIELFCSSCPSCQVTKDSNQKPSGLLHSLPIPDRPWQSIGMDFMGPLPMSEGYDYLLVVIDRFTSQVHLIPMTTCVFLFYFIILIQFSDLEAEPMVVVWQSVHEGPPSGLVCMDW